VVAWRATLPYRTVPGIIYTVPGIDSIVPVLVLVRTSSVQSLIQK
jgi:hypothetical protein